MTQLQFLKFKLLQPSWVHPPLHYCTEGSWPFHYFESGYWSGSCFGAQALPIAWLWLFFCCRSRLQKISVPSQDLIFSQGSGWVPARRKSPRAGPRPWGHQVHGGFCWLSTVMKILAMWYILLVYKKNQLITWWNLAGLVDVPFDSRG